MVGRIREILFDEGVDVDGVATLAASEDYVDAAVAGVQGDADTKISGMGTVTDNRLTKTSGTDGKALEQTGITADDTNNLSGIGSIAASGFVGKAATSQINVPVGTTGQRATPVTGDLRFNSDLVAFEGYNGAAWKSVGGGGLVATPIDKDFASALESGKHYLYNGASMAADKTINMPAIAAESYIRVTVYNIPTGYKMILAAAGTDKFIKDDTEYATVEFRSVEVEQSSSFVSNNTKWIVDDGSNALGTVWSGALYITGALSFSVTGLSNAQATAMGLKVYNIGGTYNGAVTIGVSGGVTVTSSALIPYQIQSGAWRLRFNIVGTKSSGIDATITITDVNYDYGQAISAHTGVALTDQVVIGGTDDIYLYGTANFTAVSVSGDVTLANKPSWAY